MQIVFLSNRPEILNLTLELVKRNLSFVKSVLIVCPKVLTNKFNKDFFPTKFVHDKQLLEDNNSLFIDHGIRNYQLRKKLIINDFTDPLFIMSDDDFRPIKKVNKEFYISPNGKMNLYYFYNLAFWKSRVTPFDKAQIKSRRVLEKEKLSTLSYASHMPQIIDREIFKKSTSYFDSKYHSLNVCEWTVYGNFAINKFKSKFNKPKPYATLCWPDYPNMWPLFVEPSNIHFENYYPHLYNEGDIFNDLREVPSQEEQHAVSLLKVDRYNQLRLNYSMPPLSNKNKFVREVSKLGEPVFRKLSKYKQKRLDNLKKRNENTFGDLVFKQNNFE